MLQSPGRVELRKVLDTGKYSCSDSKNVGVNLEMGGIFIGNDKAGNCGGKAMRNADARYDESSGVRGSNG